MLTFVNAKINIGLQIVQRREDGYHDLQTIFYPIGIKAGTPANPVAFCDILEVLRIEAHDLGNEDCPISLNLTGRKVDCPLEQNLVYRAAKLFYDAFQPGFGVDIHLDKHIPDGAGIGGGSADAAFLLRMLSNVYGLDDHETAEERNGKLKTLALQLGADCPFFLLNRPAYAEGVGERLEEIPLDLSGKWLLLVKPDVYVSTKDAFAGVKPHKASFDLRSLNELPLAQWRDVVHNDFEDSIFPRFPLLADIKQVLYAADAIYASLTGSGSCLYGIFQSLQGAQTAQTLFDANPTITASYLLSL